MRILLEVIAEIKRVVNDPTFLISVKINCDDSVPDGVTTDESIATAKALEAAAVDLIEISGRTYEQDQPSKRKVGPCPHHGKKPSLHGHSYQTQLASAQEAYFIDFADRLRPHLRRSKIALTGGFRTTRAMAEAIKSGSTDGRCGEPLSCSVVTDVANFSHRTGAAPGCGTLPGEGYPTRDQGGSKIRQVSPDPAASGEWLIFALFCGGNSNDV